MDILELFRVDFDNLENETINARTIKSLSVFFDDEIDSAYEKIVSYLKEIGPVHPYLGHDLGVYPLFYVERKMIYRPGGKNEN